MKQDREFVVNVTQQIIVFRGEMVNVGIMRIFKQGERCPCTRTLQYTTKGRLTEYDLKKKIVRSDRCDMSLHGEVVYTRFRPH